MKNFVACTALVFSVSCLAAPVGTNFKALFLEALNSGTGTAHAEVYGPIADEIRQKIGAPNARIVADVEVIQNLPQEGCKRMEMKLTAPGVLLPTKEGQSSKLELGTILKMCPNGEPPSS